MHVLRGTIINMVHGHACAAYLKSKRLLTISEAHVVSNKLQGARNNTFLRKLWLTIGHDFVLPVARNAGLRK